MMNQTERIVPRVPFAPHDLQGIERVLWAYSQYLQQFPLSPKQAQRVKILNQIHTRLAARLIAGNAQDVQVFLTVEELEELLQTMHDFVVLVKRLFPKNEKREAVTETVNAWRLRLVSMIAEFDAP
jgi:hypothetical protein